MKFIGYTSAICLMLVGALEYANAEPQAKPVYMTSQIQRLLNEKQEKVSKLEECDGKRKGFMIAGISTIGLTAVGIGVNVAQASKSNKLSNQIADQNRELEKQQSNLANINSQISDIQNDNRRRECESSGKVWINGQCVDKPANQPGDDQSGGNQTGGDQTGGDQLGGGLLDYDGIIGQPCTDNGDGSVWTAEGDKKCLSAEGSTDIVACSCQTPEGAPTTPAKTSTQLCLEEPERQNNPEALACCYLNKSVAKFEGGKCVCTSGDFVLNESTGRGVCVTADRGVDILGGKVIGAPCEGGVWTEDPQSKTLCLEREGSTNTKKCYCAGAWMHRVGINTLGTPCEGGVWTEDPQSQDLCLVKAGSVDTKKCSCKEIQVFVQEAPQVVAQGTIGQKCLNSDQMAWTSVSSGQYDCSTTQGGSQVVKCECKLKAGAIIMEEGGFVINTNCYGSDQMVWKQASNGEYDCRPSATSQETVKCSCNLRPGAIVM